MSLRLPAPSAHVRIDSGVVEGDTVTIFYDPMIAKLIVFDADRTQALQRLRDALAACEITGPKSNIGFLERLARHPAVVEGRIDTGYLDRHLEEFLTGDIAPAGQVDVAGLATRHLRGGCEQIRLLAGVRQFGRGQRAQFVVCRHHR